MRWEEQRKAQQQDAYNKQEVAKYQDQLARQRSEAEHQKHRERNMELVRLQVLMSLALPPWLTVCSYRCSHVSIATLAAVRRTGPPACAPGVSCCTTWCSHLQRMRCQATGRRRRTVACQHMPPCRQFVQEETSKRQEAERRAVAEQIEAERRATEKYKADLESRVQRERALAEAEGRIRENRENEDVNRRCAGEATRTSTAGQPLCVHLGNSQQ